MTPERIKDLRALCEAATEGPWEAWESSRACELASRVDAPSTGFKDKPEYAAVCYLSPYNKEFADCRFIATARTALPEALDEVERLRGEVERLRTALSTGTLALREQLRKARLPGGMTLEELHRELEEHYGPLEGFRAWLPKS